ncbi:class I adenylate-forming enzyme family protein [Caballeronia sp. LZ008]|uniref:class I adenylate-forming enzyme family protein n=1 Tax=Caballeronia sp. LZ008 TaxID=3038560 RepID=UPI0028545DF9|nr:class I adenylate-forming enzyme family protein [Caballeronia sp. LZ008]MDR5798103.1 class I adenylate-forming enzyme family protein [Caballeronia sp. LZ008]
MDAAQALARNPGRLILLERLKTSMFAQFDKEDPASLRRRVESTTLPESIYDQLLETVAAHGDKPAWHFIDSGEKRNWRDVLNGVDRVAAALDRLGVGPGAHVAVMTWNCEEFALTWLALARQQAVIVPVNATYTAREIDYALETSDAMYLVIEAEFLPRLHEIAAARVDPAHVVIVNGEAPQGSLAWDTFVNAAKGSRPREIPRHRDNLMNLQYTSGTTGFSKACMLSHDYWLVLAHTSAQFFGTPLSRFYVGSSLFYMVGQRILLNAMVSGGCAILPRKSGAKRFMRDVSAHGCDYCALFDMVYKQPPSPDDADNILKIATIFAFSPAHHRDFEQRFDVRGQEFYGMTEIGGAAYMPADALELRSGSGSCGIAAPFRELKVADENGQRVKAGERGELMVRGRGLFKGYYKREDATAECYLDGWFRTGDIARQDEDGYLYIVGRLKDMVRRNGENISAREVESVLRSMPEVQDAAVIAVPDPYHQEEVKAYIQLAPGLTAEAVPPELIVEFCRPLLAAFKLPRYVEYRDSLPLTDSQRVQKKVLRSEKADLRIGAYDLKEQCWR